MTKTLFTFAFAAISLSTYAQDKNFIDQPYLETTATADSAVIPDRIFINISLSEADSKNKKSTEEIENTLERTLKDLGIDTQKDLTLLNYDSKFKNYLLKRQDIMKAKQYSLLVHDAMMANAVLQALENVGISNVSIERTAYSKAEELLLSLKIIAIKKSRTAGQKMLESLNQKLGKAIHITDHQNAMYNQLQGRMRGVALNEVAVVAKPIDVEFEKIKFESSVSVKYIIE